MWPPFRLFRTGSGREGNQGLAHALQALAVETSGAAQIGPFELLQNKRRTKSLINIYARCTLSYSFPREA